MTGFIVMESVLTSDHHVGKKRDNIKKISNGWTSDFEHELTSIARGTEHKYF
jgi:hypothetical protein